MDPLDFLRRHAPFDEVSTPGAEGLAAALEITWARSGERIVARGAVNHHLYVVRKGRVRLELDGQGILVLGPGEPFGLTSIGPAAPERTAEVVEASPKTPAATASFDARAESDCLLYRLPADAVRRLCDTEPGFGRFFIEDLARRLQRLTAAQAVPLTSDLGRAVGDLVQRPPVTLTLGGDAADRAAEPTVGDAARTMVDAGVSSVLVTDGAEPSGLPVGIVTDRDLRRALARGLGVDTPLRQIMTSPVEHVEASVPGAEALLHLLRSGRHHLVLAADDQLVGVVTHSDLLRRQLQGPGALLDEIRRARGADELEGYADRIGAMVETLHLGGLGPTAVGRVVAALNDALCAHLLDLAERDVQAELGPPPADHAWIVFGSEGRQEQSFLTDQDNALVYGDREADREVDAESGAGVDPAVYFERLAQRGVESLLTVGFPPCAGDFMATHWCLPLDAWCRLFRTWIDEPEPENLMRVANFFDWRVVHGGLDLEPLEEIVRGARDNRRFIGQLARASMKKRPPLGLLDRIVEDADGVDLKSGALMPIAGLARLLALEAGQRTGSTLRRLEAAARAGTLSADGHDLLAEAFRFAFGLRLRAQLADRRAGRPLTNSVRLDQLSAAERRHLKDAFVAIDRLQKATEQRLGTGILG
ncbi:MAG: putative nucleotidyltransferase substrate binding domain-containing protein [Acidobacteriota bacterium]